jgi:hypothetical protein
MNLTRLELFLLCTNLMVLGGLGVLMLIRGPSVPVVLLALGALGMSVAKIGKAMSSAANKS